VNPETPPEDRHDEQTRRCPRLGGPIRFGYCRTAGEDGGPCRKSLDCWWERFDVAGHLRRILGPERLAAFAALADRGPRPKVTSLLDQIRAARSRTGMAEPASEPNRTAKGGENDH
jgi:hypothetical protein